MFVLYIYSMILDPGFNLTLRPMKYPALYDMYKAAVKNTWTVEEVDFSTDIVDLKSKLSPGDQHLIHRLVAFFATGDSIVSNNLVINLYKHVNSPEARMFLSRQLYEEALHVEFYLTLLDTYLPDHKEREEAFAAIHNIPSIKRKAEFCFKWIDSINNLQSLQTKVDRRQFLLNLICFAACIEGLFFFSAFAYVYFYRSRGFLQGLATGTNWVFRDESGHISFANSIVNIAKSEEPDLFDSSMKEQIKVMVDEAIECEVQFAEDILSKGVVGLSKQNVRQYLQYVANQRFAMLGMEPQYKATNPFPFMAHQDVQELTNFFERRVSSYQTGIAGTVSFDENF